LPQLFAGLTIAPGGWSTVTFYRLAYIYLLFYFRLPECRST
jgi:hypothetical protein